MSPTSFRFFVSFSDIQENRTLLSASVRFLMVPGISAMVFHSCVILRPTEIVCIHLLTVCYVCISVFDAPAPTIPSIIWRRSVGVGVKIAGKKVGFGLSGGFGRGRGRGLRR